MLAICGGLMRTGSVAMFQIMREIAIVKGVGFAPLMPHGREAEYFDSNCCRWAGTPEVYVAKLHSWREQISRCHSRSPKVVLTIRDFRDVVVSLMHFRWNSSFETTIHSNAYKNWIHDYQTWVDEMLPENLLIVKYEDMIADRFTAILTVADFMEHPVNAPEARAIDVKWDIKANQKRAQEAHSINSIDYMSQRHIYDGSAQKWRKELTEEQVAIVEEYAGEWLKEHGYN